MSDLTVANVFIPEDAHGRFNLTVLHQASGGDEAKYPGHWLKRKSTKALVTELENQLSFSTIDVVKGGNASGTYVHELLAISYAGWISPRFQLLVNQAFLDMKRQPSLPPAVPSAPLLPIPEEIAARQLAAWLNAGQQLSCPAYHVQQEAVKAVRASTGVDYAPLLLSAPAQDNIPEDETMLEPTDLAGLVGWDTTIAGGRRMNEALAWIGWQTKSPGGTWTPTAQGAPHAAKHAWTKGEKSGHNLKWRVSAVRQALNL